MIIIKKHGEAPTRFCHDYIYVKNRNALAISNMANDLKFLPLHEQMIVPTK